MSIICNQIARLLAIATFGAGACIASAPATLAASPTELVLATAIPAQMGSGKAVQFFAKRVEELSKGAVRVKLHMGGTLYSEVAAVQAMKNREIDLATVSEGGIAGFSKQLVFLQMPYLFKSPAAMVRFLQSDAFVGGVREKLQSEGMLTLAFLENGGFRVVANTRKLVHVPADLSKVTLRTTPSPVDVALIGALGASPTPLAWAETYNALSQGVVDGVYVPYVWLGTGRVLEVAKYATEVNANLSVQTLMMDPQRFASLPEPAQNALRTAARETEDQALKFNLEEIEYWKKQAAEGGVTIYVPTASEMEQWEAAGRSIWEKYSADVPKSLLDRILQSQQ